MRTWVAMKSLAVFAYASAGLALSASATRLALDTVGMPFGQVLPFQNLYIGAFTQRTWQGGVLGLSFHDRIEAAGGQPLRTADEWNASLRAAPGFVEARFSRKGVPLNSRISVAPLPAKDVFEIVFPLLATGIGFWLIGTLVLLISPAPPGAFPFALYCAATGTYFLAAYDFHTTYRLTAFLLAAFALIPASILDFSVRFPRLLPGRSVWRALPYAVSAALGVPYLLWFTSRPSVWVAVEYLFFGYLSAAYLCWAVRMLRVARADPEEAVRGQARMILLPLLPAFGLIFVVLWLVFLFGVPVPLNWVVPVCTLFPVAVAYGMLRRNLFLADRLEAQVVQRTAELRTAQAELAESTKLAAVGLLAAGTAHEIGNAMNLISSNLPVLRKYAVNLLALTEIPAAEQEKRKGEIDFEFLRRDLKDLLESLETGAQRAIGIVRDLKAFAKPPSAPHSEVDLKETVEMVLRLLRGELGGRIFVEWKAADVPAVAGSAGQIQQVLVNVILNAAQAIEGNGTISVELSRDDDMAVLSVKDTGKGLSPEELRRAFEPFFTTKEKGTGLGLSVSYGIVQAHGGKIAMESGKNGGTHVKIFLPLRKGR